MAKKVQKQEEGYISTCYKCGKKEILIGPRGKGLCDACIAKSNAPYTNGTRGFVNDFDQKKQVVEKPKTRKSRKKGE